jgi:mRNA-degrading endonuclease toxin of MazEF toxin-antitoxin module
MAKLGEVWWAPFDFSDKPWNRKRRPVVVIDVDVNSCLCTTVMVTSKSNHNYDEEMVVVYWQNAGLSRPSYIRLGRKQVFLVDDLYKRIGVLDGRDQFNLWPAIENYQNKKRQR